MRVLFLTHRLPYAPNRGDRIRAYHTLRLLRGRAEVHLLSLVHDADERAHLRDLDGLAQTVTGVDVPRLWNWVNGAAHIPTRRPLTHALLDSPQIRPAIQRIVHQHSPDVVLAYCSGMARFAVEPPLDRLPFVLDMVDVDSLKWEALAPASPWPMRFVYAREARCLRAFERTAMRRARRTLVINDKERDALLAFDPSAPVVTVPSGVDVTYLRPDGPPSDGARVVFCGVMNYQPNEDAAEWLAREVWPHVRRRRPDARLQVVGSHPSPRVAALASDSIEVTGGVPDVRPYLWGAAVGVAPLRVARGMQNKVLEALAAGLPVVITPVVAEGLPREVLPGCRIAADAAAFGAAIVDLLALTPVERRGVAAAAALDGLSWEARLAPVYEALREAAEAPALQRAERRPS